MQFFVKRIWLMVFLLVVVQLLGCNGGTTKEVESKYENGKPKIVKYYTREGQSRRLIKEIQYYPSGEIKVDGEYVEDKKNGQWIFYYENGTVWSKSFFSQGLPTGKTLVYHENGQLFYEGEYLNGLKQGIWNFYNEDGQLVNNIIFNEGKIENQSGKQVHPNDTGLIK